MSKLIALVQGPSARGVFGSDTYEIAGRSAIEELPTGGLLVTALKRGEEWPPAGTIFIGDGLPDHLVQVRYPRGGWDKVIVRTSKPRPKVEQCSDCARGTCHR